MTSANSTAITTIGTTTGTSESASASASTGAGASASVELIAVTKSFGTLPALDGISLSLHPGELVALLGPSGCGKTTALRVLAGLESLDTGHIIIDGIDVARVPTNKRDIGMVFQAYSLFPHVSVLDNVEFGLRMRRVPARTRTTRAREALELVGLGDHAHRFAHQLSGGQQQRVALARALVTRPRMLLLDEPLSALDAQVRVQLRDEIRRIQTELGITTVFVTHDQEEALAVADRVAVMREGRIEQIGTPEQLYLSPANSFVAGFIGLSNHVSAVVSGGVLRIQGTVVPVAGEQGEQGEQGERGALGKQRADGPVTAFVRPENVVLSPSASTSTSASTSPSPSPTSEIAPASAVVVSSSFLGSLRRTVVRLSDGTELTAQHEASNSFSVGETVGVRVIATPVLVTSRNS